ncbi:MAG: DUF928 domain-containing protein [Coleofasciculaceae cyanobacterium]
MKTLKILFSKPSLFHLIALSVSLTVFSNLFTPVKAQTQSSPSTLMPVVSFEPPDDQKTLDDSRGGASRTTTVKCSQDQAYSPSMTALTPGSKLGLTVASHPTFFAYIPATSAQQAHFTLKDDHDRGVYQTLLPINSAGGVVSITLPEDKPPLELGKTYSWSVALMCQPTQTDTPMVRGQVRRVELKAGQMPNQINSMMSQKAILEQAALYGKSGIWYDSINLLAKLRQAQPNDQTLATNWVKLLDSVGLEAVANQPLK